MKEYTDFYSCNTNHYHTIYHIDNLLKLWEEYREEFLKEYPDLNEDALITAIKWHDSYYVPGEDANEFISIQRYADNVEMIDPLVCLIIESTIIGYDQFDLSPELKVMHDLDWSGFNNYIIFKDNCEKIYQEVIDHNPFPKEDENFGQKIRRNQIEFYRKFAKNQLYLTKTFSKFNYIAKENMLKLADELENTYFCRKSVFDCTGMFQNMQPQITIADEKKFFKAIERLATSDKGDKND